MATYLTTEQILEHGRAVAAAEAKAAREPENLTIEDVNTLDGTTISRLMVEGKVTHLGLGQPKPSRRRRR